MIARLALALVSLACLSPARAVQVEVWQVSSVACGSATPPTANFYSESAAAQAAFSTCFNSGTSTTGTINCVNGQTTTTYTILGPGTWASGQLPYRVTHRLSQTWLPQCGGGPHHTEQVLTYAHLRKAFVESPCAVGSVASEGYYDVGTKATGSPKMLTCSNGCEAVFDGISPAGSTMENGVRRYYAQGRYYRTGGVCEADTAGGDLPDVGAGGGGVPPVTCSAGQAKGQVNGIDVCIDQQGNQQGSAGKSSGGTKTSRDKVTNPDGSTTETTKETTTENNGRGGVSTTTKTTTENCSSSGSCTTETEWVGGTVGGEDGEQEDPVDACEANPDRVGCKELGTPTGETLTGLTRPLGITPATGFDQPDECPADKVLNLAHVTLTVPFSLLCQAADMARPIVVGVAWLSAILGFLGLARKG